MLSGIDATGGELGDGANDSLAVVAEPQVQTVACEPAPPQAAPLVARSAGTRSGSRPAIGWMRRYQLRLLSTDLAAAGVAGAVAYLARFGASPAGPAGSYLVLAILFPFVWTAAVALNRGYDSRLLGGGATEFQRIYWSFLHVTAGIAIGSYAFKAELARGFVLVALPLVLCLELPARFVARKLLHRRRARGQAMSSVVLAGQPTRVADLARDLRRDAFAGLDVIGACVPAGACLEEDGLNRLDELGVPVLGELDDIRDVVRLANADTVAVTSSAEIGPDKLRWIAWQLEGTDAELAVSPGLVDVAGTRIHVRPAAGLPLLYVEAPRFSGPHQLLKTIFDRAAAAVALLLISPLLVLVTLAIRCTSTGPALFRQTRIGRNGEEFTMIKFRSMFVAAEDRLAELSARNENADGLLFKMRDDPRVTQVGRLLRRFSIDELPQLLNVLGGSMSLVGPRPPLPGEVARYGDDVRRRLLVKPGLTGLWQVSGRSDLSWEDSVRLDLRYVENWSLALDMLVLWKTVRAVFTADGAY